MGDLREKARRLGCVRAGLRPGEERGSNNDDNNNDEYFKRFSYRDGPKSRRGGSSEACCQMGRYLACKFPPRY